MKRKNNIFVMLFFLFLFPISVFSADWTAMNSGTTYSLHSIWGSSGSDVYAVGDNGTMIHYDGSTWSPVEIKVEATLYSVWGSSAKDVFAVGDIWCSTANNTINCYVTPLHYNGNTWSYMPDLLGTPNSNLKGIWGSSGSDIFVVGDRGVVSDQGYIIHYDGNTWSRMESGAHDNLTAVWGSSDSDVFAVGDKGTILHYDGSSWSIMSSGTTNRLNAIWGSSGSDVYAVGGFCTILHYDGNVWSSMSNPFTGSVGWLSAVWGSSAKDVFAVGTYNYGPQAGTILHYNGDKWNTMDIDPVENIFAVWGSSGSDVFAAGKAGLIYHYAGGGIPPVCLATKVLGKNDPRLDTLRTFRDKVLDKTEMGKGLINFYYNNGDQINEALDKNPALKESVKKLLELMIPLIDQIVGKTK